jgi:hypothetical protein
VENPEAEYALYVIERQNQIVGYIVLKCEARFGLEMGFIADMLTLPGEPDLTDGLISEAVKFFQARRMHLVSCLMLEHLPCIGSLERNGFLRMPRRLFPQELFFSVRHQSDEYDADFITDPENWYITWGDHDMV